MWCEGIAEAQRRLPTQVEWFSALKDVQLRSTGEIAHGIFIAEGEVVIRRAHAAGYRLLALLAEHRWIDPLRDLIDDTVDVIAEIPERMTEITGYHVHRGALAAFQRRDLPSPVDLLSRSRRCVFIEGMVNHTNVGAIFRSAAAMRMDAVLVDRHCADPLYRRAIRTSMGTVFQVPWTRADLSELDLRDAGPLCVVALTPDPDAQDIRSIDWGSISRLALIIGTEGSGLSPAALGRADVKVTIPMSGGIDSLNAAAAAAVASFEIMRSVR